MADGLTRRMTSNTSYVASIFLILRPNEDLSSESVLCFSFLMNVEAFSE